MTRRKVMRAGAGLLVATSAVFGLSACGGGDGGGEQAPSVEAEADVDVAVDLQTARQAVEDALAEDPTWTQVMLAGDVTQPTQKYGLLVMPFVQSEAADRVTGTVEIDDGSYTIEAESAETGQTWQIDQDGAISEVTE